MNFEHCNGEIYTIQRGDSLYSISKKYNVPLAMILWANPYSDIYNLQVGDDICIPRRLTPNFGYPGSNTSMEDGSQPEGVPQGAPYSRMPMNNMPMNNMPMNNMPMNNMPMDNMPMDNMPMDNMPRNNVPTPRTYQMDGDIVMLDYVVQENDSLQSILDYFDIELEDFIQHNSMENIKLEPGTTIIIPQESER